MTESTYESYRPGGAAAPTPHQVGEDPLGGQGPWRVAIEYANHGDQKPPTVVQVGRNEFADRETALLAARRACFEFDPPDPWSPQGREVLRDGPDSFLVIIQGAMSTFHMSVRIVARVEAP